MTELKDCPFCGGKAEAYKREKWYSRAIDIRCSNNSCGAHFAGFSANEWNTRTAPEGVVLTDRMKLTAVVMANGRRLIKANKITSNQRLYMEMLGTGMTTARVACIQLGLHPEGNETFLSVMLDSISTLNLVAKAAQGG